jgi:endonuclease G
MARIYAGIFLLLFTAWPAWSAEDSIYRVDHVGFTLWLDCHEHGAIRFRCNAQHDSGNYPRQDDFRFDPDVPPECQQLNTDSYHTDPPAAEYQRGHLVPANHLDFSEQALAESFYMTNILPQTATLNTGAWRIYSRATFMPPDRRSVGVTNRSDIGCRWAAGG